MRRGGLLGCSLYPPVLVLGPVAFVRVADMGNPDPDRVIMPERPGLSIADLKPAQCRFIVAESPVRYCGGPTVHIGSWCKKHRHLVYSKRAGAHDPTL